MHAWFYRQPRIASRVAWFACGLVIWLIAGPLAAGPIRLGTVSAEVERTHARWQPFIDALNREASLAAQPVGLEVFNSYGGLHWAMLGGDLDGLVDEPVLALSMAQTLGASPMAMVSLQERDRDAACIVVLHESEVERLQDLGGKLIAFDKPSSTFGHALARLLLVDAGLELAEVQQNAPQVALPDEHRTARFVYTMDRLAPVAWLYDKRADAAAVSEALLRRVQATRPELVRALACSERLAPAMVVVSETSPWREALRSSLASMNGHASSSSVRRLEDEAGIPQSVRRAEILLRVP